VNIRAVKHNERWKGFAAIADNIALALLVGGGVKFYSVHKIDDDVKYAAIGAVIAVIGAWILRGFIRPEN
jgi:hypothetical protein